MRIGKRLNFDREITNEAETIRKKHHEYYDSAKKTEFKIVPRVQFYNQANRTQFDAGGNCDGCGVEVVFDERTTTGLKFCVPCATKIKNNGMLELQALGSLAVDSSGRSDEELYQELEARVALTEMQNNREGYNDPKHIQQPKAPLLEKFEDPLA